MYHGKIARVFNLKRGWPDLRAAEVPTQQSLLRQLENSDYCVVFYFFPREETEHEHNRIIDKLSEEFPPNPENPYIRLVLVERGSGLVTCGGYPYERKDPEKLNMDGYVIAAIFFDRSLYDKVEKYLEDNGYWII
jgi:hypothetical protein